MTALLAGLLALAASCDRNRIDPAPEETCDVEFRLTTEGETRATGVSAANEERINRWALFVFRNGTLVTSGTSGSSASITKTLTSGATYNVYAVVNYVTSGTGSFNPSSVTTESALTGTESYLAGNSLTSLQMYGADTFTATGGSQTKNIPVYRLVSKVGVKMVTVNMSNPAIAAQTFVLNNIWMDNVYSRTTFGSDYTYNQLSATRSMWYNTMNRHASGSCTNPSCPDAILEDWGINATVAQGSSHNVEHWFYVVPNATTAAQDNRTSSWSRRCTRLVIQATIGGKVNYYVVTLPGMLRNNSYTINDAVITNTGSEDPEQVVPGSINVVFSTSDPAWEGPVTITEES